MSFQWPLDPQELFSERYPQIVNTGLPASDVDAVRARITDMWADAPGGWVHEWSTLAKSYVDAGSPQRSVLAYGWAKFPTLADEGNGVVAHLGISMGGHFSARTGLAGEVDAAVVFGGPVEHAFAKDRPSHFGMGGIVGNALGFAHEPSQGDLAEHLAPFSLRSLLDQDRNCPMLIINGADDVHVPQHDTLVFRGRRETVADLIPGTGHCATTKLPEAIATIADWLATTLATLSAKAAT